MIKLLRLGNMFKFPNFSLTVSALFLFKIPFKSVLALKFPDAISTCCFLRNIRRDDDHRNTQPLQKKKEDQDREICSVTSEARVRDSESPQLSVQI